MAPIQRRFTDVLMTKRLQTLQSIDEGVEKVVKLLQVKYREGTLGCPQSFLITFFNKFGDLSEF